MSKQITEQAEALALKLQALQTALEASRIREQRYNGLCAATLAAYAHADVIADESGKPMDYRLIEVNDSFARLVGLQVSETVGHTIRELMPNIDAAWIEALGKVALSGEPDRFEFYSEAFGRRWFEVFAYSPAPHQFMHLFFDISARKQTEAELEDQLRFSQVLLDAIPVPVFYKNRRGVYTGGNQAFAAYLGRPLNAIVGHTVYEVAPPHLAEIYHRADEELFARGGIQTYGTRVRFADSTEHDVIFYKATFSLGDDKAKGMIGTIFDVSEQKRMERGLRESEARFRRQATELETIYRSAPVGLAVLDHDLRYQRINEHLARINGLPVEAHIGKSVGEVVPWFAEIAETLGREILSHGDPIWDFEFVSRNLEPGGIRFYVTHWLPLKDETGSVWGINLVLEETTDRKRMEEHTRHMAQYDALTDLPNRRLLIELFDAELRKARRARKQVALLFIDLDRFKTINDTLGHDAGDVLLKAVARRLVERVRRSDVVARLGGDEFTVLLPDLVHGEQAGEIAAGLLREFQRPFQVAEQTLYVTASIGISLFPNDGDTADVLLRCADVAMYVSKEEARNTFRFYNAAVGHRAHERLRVENRLREALERGGLVLHYQPEVDLRTGQLHSVEALVRWNHPELGMLDPARFIPIAEETNLIASLDEWVLKAACAQAHNWIAQGFSPFYICVNLSAKGFEDPHLARSISHSLAEQGLSPEYLQLELTERTVMRHIDQTVERMRELVTLGVGIALDDFGTGYSSLNYLKRLPISKLKIDKSFIRDIDTDPDDRSIVEAITGLAHTLNKRVLAEGVETAAQRDFLRDNGCDEAQGFLFTRPLPADQIASLLAH